MISLSEGCDSLRSIMVNCFFKLTVFVYFFVFSVFFRSVCFVFNAHRMTVHGSFFASVTRYFHLFSSSFCMRRSSAEVYNLGNRRFLPVRQPLHNHSKYLTVSCSPRQDKHTINTVSDQLFQLVSFGAFCFSLSSGYFYMDVCKTGKRACTSPV